MSHPRANHLHIHGATSPNDAGFTLVEVLIAITIFAIIATAGSGLLTMSISAKQATETAQAKVNQLRVTRSLIKSDMAQTILQRSRDPFGGQKKSAFEGGRAAKHTDGLLLSFARTGHTNPNGLIARSTNQHVRYIVRDNQLIRQASQRLNPGPDTSTFERILLDDIQSAAIRFYDGNNWQDSWVATGYPGSKLPRAIALDITPLTSSPKTDTSPAADSHYFLVRGAMPQ